MRSDNRYQSRLNQEGKTGEPQLFSGIGMPSGGTVMGTFGTKSDEEVIRSAVEMCLMTGRGERVMRPTFGSGIQYFVFEQSDELLQITLRSSVIETLTEFEDRITLNSVNIILDEERVLISILMSIPRSYGKEDVSMSIPLDREKLFR